MLNPGREYAQFRVGFLQEIPYKVPFFIKKSLTMGLIFKIYMRTPENFEKLACYSGKIARKGVPFFRKNPLIWVLIFGKMTPEHGYES